MTTVILNDLESAMDWVSTDYVENLAYVCRTSGKIYWISGEPGVLDEEDEIPDDIDDPDKYVPVPDKRDLDLGSRLVFDFTMQYLPQHYDEVRDMFRRKGAYGRFKGLLERHDKMQTWYSFSEERTSEALEAWCKEERLDPAP
jgi:hypothetical protein